MERVGRYQILRHLAKGGMAEVFLARAEGPAGFSKDLVLKRILPERTRDRVFVEMFLNEARLAARLNHPHVVQIFELGEEGGTYHLAMEWVDSTHLRGLLKAARARGQTLPLAAVLRIVSQAAEGLAYAHELRGDDGQPLGLVHRDVSPENILLSRQGAVKVADFGIAKAADSPHTTQVGMVKGKVRYMAPEHLRGEPLDARADLYSLGLVLFEALTGVKPFSASDEGQLRESERRPPPLSQLRPEAPPELQRILDRALAPKREARYPSCRALQAELEQVLASRGAQMSAADLGRLVDLLIPPMAQPSAPPPPAPAPLTAAPESTARPRSNVQLLAAVRPRAAGEAPPPAAAVEPAAPAKSDPTDEVTAPVPKLPPEWS
jgi:serine/threonine-protein kinase